jgi:hypothetical protein
VVVVFDVAKYRLNYAKKNWPKNLKKYAEQEKILNGRNSAKKI